MKQINSELWQTETHRPLPFLKTQSYFLKTAKGNALFYNTGNEKELAQMAELGGISNQYLSHRHESGKNLKDIKSQFDSKLVCDSVEAQYISKDCKVDTEISERTQFENRIVAILTPGHTSGGCCYYYESPNGERYIFTGDLFYVDGDKLSTFVYTPDGGSNSELINSLKFLKQFEPTIVLSSAFGGSDSALKITLEIWKSEIDRNIKNLK